MVIFSILFQFAYRIKPYTGRSDLVEANNYGSKVETRYLGGFLGVKALLAALNVSDLVKGILVAPGKLIRGRRMAKEELASSGEASSKTELTDATQYADFVQRPQQKM